MTAKKENFDLLSSLSPKAHRFAASLGIVYPSARSALAVTFEEDEVSKVSSADTAVPVVLSLMSSGYEPRWGLAETTRLDRQNAHHNWDSNSIVIRNVVDQVKHLIEKKTPKSK